MNFLYDTLTSAYTQLAMISLLSWYFVSHRKDPRMPVSRVGLIRMIVVWLIFVNFLFSWASGIRPALAMAAVLGMFFINLFLLNALILSRMEMPYRDAVATYCLEPQSIENLDAIWSTGKRFYYMRHFFSALMSGTSTMRYLHEIAGSRIRDDIQACLRQRDLTQQFISLNGMIAYLEGRLAEEEMLPTEFKEVVRKALESFKTHPWVEDKINEYLKMALENPENIHNPEWSLRWEKTRTAKYS